MSSGRVDVAFAHELHECVGQFLVVGAYGKRYNEMKFYDLDADKERAMQKFRIISDVVKCMMPDT